VAFFDWSQSQLLRVPAIGGTASAVATGLVVTGSSMAMDDRSVYYVAESGLVRFNRAGGDSQLFAAGTVRSFVIDDACVYWGDASEGAIFVQKK
jgi:hypothetical protein